MNAGEVRADIRRLLVVKIADIGDLLLTTPALAALRRAYPAARLDLVTSPHAAPILDGMGLIDHVILSKGNAGGLRDHLRLGIQLRAAHYDAVLVFHQLTTRLGMLKQALLLLASGAPIRCGLDNGRGWFFTHRIPDRGFGACHQVENWLAVAALLGATTEHARPLIGITEADRAWARARLPDLPSSAQYVAIHPGSGGFNPARRWPPERFAAVADALCRDHEARIVVVGGRDDGADEMIRAVSNAPINLAGQTTLGQLAAALERCALYIGADSGVTHIATTIPALRIVALFGPTNDHAWGPYSPQAAVIRSGVLCSPCGYIGHTLGLKTGCEARTCMRLITPDQVMAAATGGESGEAARLTSSPDYREGASGDGSKPRLRILGIPIDKLTYPDLLAHIGSWIGDGRARMICTANPELVMIAQRDPLFFAILNRAQLVTADGVGMVWAARWLRRPLPARITGSDGLPIIAERAAREGWRIFLLGAAPGVAERAADVLRTRYPGLQIADTFAGSPAAKEEDEIVARINASDADVLFVAYGSPTQEKWIARNLPRLKVSVAMGVGGAFDFVAGVTQRAPEWMRRTGIEWLHRLIRQPWRWRRMLRLPRFVLAVLLRGPRGPHPFVGKGVAEF